MSKNRIYKYDKSLVPEKDLQPVFTRTIQGEEITIIGVENMWQQCRVCGHLKHQSDFTLHGRIDKYARKMLKNECRDCDNENNKLLYELKKENGPPLPHCQICDKECNTTLDHCHDTKTFRGWLCIECNLALGKFKDSVAMLERAIKYLKGELNE